MTEKPQELQRRIARFSIFGIIFTALFVGLTTAVPLHLYAKKDIEKNLVFNAKTQALTVQEHLSKLHDIATQITSRTKARELLEAYNTGKISLEELQQNVSPILRDAMTLSQLIVGITRVSLKGIALVKVGTPIEKGFWETKLDSAHSAKLLTPVYEGNKQVILFIAPIRNRNGAKVGFDIIAFQMNQLNEIVKHYESINENPGNISIAWKTGNNFGFLGYINQIFNFRTIQQDLDLALRSAIQGKSGLVEGSGNFSFAYAPISEFNWALLISANKDEIYSPARRETLIVVISILIFLLIGIFGTIKLIRPLSGKVLIHSDALQNQVQQKTSALIKSNRSLKTLSVCNEIIMRANDEIDLLYNICHTIVKIGGYRMAWIGVAQQDRFKTVKPVASAGKGLDYLHKIKISWADNPYGQGPTGKAIRERFPQVVNNTQAEQNYSPWKEQAEQHGYASSIALPLIYENQSLGVLNIYATETSAFDTQETLFLSQLANDLSFGIATIRARVQHNKAQEQMRKLSSAVEHTANIIMITNDTGIIEYVNPEFERATGFKRKDVIGKTPSILKSDHHKKPFYLELWNTIKQGKVYRGTFVNRKKDGGIFYEEKNITPIKDKYGQITHFVSTGKDITERIENEQKIEHLAYHDSLTGLPNRGLFRDRLQHAMTHAKRENTSLALMFLDLDRFKQINDSFGHIIGDELLQAVATRLQEHLRKGDTIARLGGDEFTIISENIQQAEDAANIASNVVNLMQKPFTIGRQEIFMGTSIGIALYPEDARTIDELISAADSAMYRAKEEGRNNYQFFTSDMTAKAFERMLLENALRHALEREEFILHYQPRINLKTDEVQSVEALIRWQHPEKGLVLPSHFVPLLEETNLIVPVTEWVLRESCRQLQLWHEHGLHDMRIAVNLPANIFRQEKIIDIVEKTVGQSNIDARQIELEITESILMDNTLSNQNTMERLRELGFLITIDDFGTGYSSLSYLKQLPIHCLKIDKSFIHDIGIDDKDEAISKAIISLAHSLNLLVTAEGIENSCQLEYLQALHCNEGQGNFFCQPINGDELCKWLTHRPKKAI